MRSRGWRPVGNRLAQLFFGQQLNLRDQALFQNHSAPRVNERFFPVFFESALGLAQHRQNLRPAVTDRDLFGANGSKGNQDEPAHQQPADERLQPLRNADRHGKSVIPLLVANKRTRAWF